MVAPRSVLLLLLLLLMMLAGFLTGAKTECQPAPVNTELFSATIRWTYNRQTGECTGQKINPNASSSSPTPTPTTIIGMNETKPIEGLGNDCLHFGCWYQWPWIDKSKSACPVDEGCSRDLKWSETTTDCPGQSCGCFLGLYDAAWPFATNPGLDNNNNNNNNNHIFAGNYSVYSHYVCQPYYAGDSFNPGYPPYNYYHTAHWAVHPGSPYHAAYHYPTGYPTYPGYPLHPADSYHPAYNPLADPLHPAYHPLADPYHPAYQPLADPNHPANQYPWGDPYHPAFHYPPGNGYHVGYPAQWPLHPGVPYQPGPWAPGSPWYHPAFNQGHFWPTNNPWNPPDYHNIKGCSHNGTTVTEGKVTEGTTCWQTVCRGGKLVNETRKDYKGCAYLAGNQCVKEGKNISVHEHSTCYTYTCLKNQSTSHYDFDITGTGCFYKGHCYPANSKVADESKTVSVNCHVDVTSGKFSLIRNKTGCSHKGKTVAEGTVTEDNACRRTVCSAGELKTHDLTGYDGCAYDPKHQCIKEGSSVSVHEESTCYIYTCLRNQSTSRYEFDKKGTGCFYEGDCYPEDSKVAEESEFETINCQFDATTGEFSLVHNKTGCSHNGETVAEGAVVKEDPCRQTVCEGGELVDKNSTDYDGCAYAAWNQCVQEGSSISIHEQTTCFTLTCRQNASSSSQYEFDIERSGCYYEGKCYPGGVKVEDVSECKSVSCRRDPKTGQFSLVYTFTGCYTSDGDCHSDTEWRWDKCRDYTCIQDKMTGDYSVNVTYKGCISLTNRHDCRFDTDESEPTENNSCIYSTCKSSGISRWETHFKSTANCSVESQYECLTSAGHPGCEYHGDCYPVKTVKAWNDCTQFVCFSDDVDLNQGRNSTTVVRPMWEPRATGCYGPPGCMKFGEEYVDPSTKNTYRCGYDIGGLGHKFAELLPYCDTPTGDSIPLGRVVRGDLAYYACTRTGLEKLIINQIVPTPGEDPDCGPNPAQNETMFPGNRYNLNTAYCDVLPDCSMSCDYFDTPCYLDDKEKNAETRTVGEKFTVDDAECVCTRDTAINNYTPESGSRANTPSLCAEDGVKGGACKDPKSTVLRVWGEMWVLPDTDPLEICTCDPGNRTAFCAPYLPDVVNVTSVIRTRAESITPLL